MSVLRKCAQRLYQLSRTLQPATQQTRYGEEMDSVFAEMVEEASSEGMRGQLRLCMLIVREVAGQSAAALLAPLRTLAAAGTVTCALTGAMLTGLNHAGPEPQLWQASTPLVDLQWSATDNPGRLH